MIEQSRTSARIDLSPSSHFPVTSIVPSASLGRSNRYALERVPSRVLWRQAGGLLCFSTWADVRREHQTLTAVPR